MMARVRYIFNWFHFFSHSQSHIGFFTDIFFLDYSNSKANKNLVIHILHIMQCTSKVSCHSKLALYTRTSSCKNSQSGKRWLAFIPLWNSGFYIRQQKWCHSMKKLDCFGELKEARLEYRVNFYIYTFYQLVTSFEQLKKSWQILCKYRWKNWGKQDS